MAKGKKDDVKKKPTYKNVGIKAALWAQLHAIGKPQERSVNWLVARAVKEWLERQKPAE